MSENYETKSVRDLREYITGASKDRERAAVNKLLSLNGGKPVQEPKYGDSLTREMMKSVER